MEERQLSSKTIKSILTAFVALKNKHTKFFLGIKLNNQNKQY